MESPPVVDLSSPNNRPDRDNLADLNAASKIPGLTITPSIMPLSVLDNGQIGVSCSSGSSQYPNRRVLRPRTEPRSYVESPDTLAAMNGKLTRQEQSNGNTPMDSDTDDEKMPPDYAVKVRHFNKRFYHIRILSLTFFYLRNILQLRFGSVTGSCEKCAKC